MAREGQAQLAVYVKQPVMDGLRDYVRQAGGTLTAAVERAVGLLLAGTPVAPVDELAALSARIEALEAVVQAGVPAKAEAPITAAGVEAGCANTPRGRKARSTQPPSEVQLAIAELASTGMSQAAIAAELAKRGFTTAAGGAIRKGDSRICKAVKAVKNVSS